MNTNDPTFAGAISENALTRFRRFASTYHHTTGVALLRIALGTIVLMIYALHVAQFKFLWGPQGVIPFGEFLKVMHIQHNFSLYELSSSTVVALILYWLGFLITFLFTIGYKSRIMAIGFFVFTWSLYSRNQMLLDGGDNLLYLIAFFMMFVNCGAALSLDNVLGKKRGTANPFLALLHNYAVLAMITQVSLLYFTSAFFKIQGHMWQDGTAIYYVLRTAEFNLSPLGKIIYSSAFLVTFLTYSTMVFQMAFPFLIWNRKLKPFMILGALCLHLSIAYFMGLFWFSMVMISAELVILGDKDYQRFATIGRKLLNLTHVLSTSSGRPEVLSDMKGGHQ